MPMVVTKARREISRQEQIYIHIFILVSFDWTKAFPACEKILSPSPLALRSEISRNLAIRKVMGGGGKSKNKYRAGETEKKIRAPEMFEKKNSCRDFSIGKNKLTGPIRGTV